LSEHRASQAPSPALAQDPASWGIFTRLLHQLDVCTKASDQIQETLEAVREATGADLVCWHNETTGENLSTAPDHPLSPEGCRAVVQNLLARSPEDKGSLLWHNPRGAEGRPDRLPHSAAAVRLRRARPDWILALSSRRDQPLDRIDLRLIGLACAMLVKQNQPPRL